MRQLAGLPCVVCQRSVDSIVEGRFCDECGGAVHKECINPEAARYDESKCAACGGDPGLAEGALQRQDFTPTRPVPLNTSISEAWVEQRQEPPAGHHAFTFNGIGTSYCGAEFFGSDGGDAVLCFVIFFMPIFPLGAFHLFHRTSAFLGSKFQTVPLRMSGKLVLRVYLLIGCWGLWWLECLGPLQASL
jgi:hypothetical protein